MRSRKFCIQNKAATAFKQLERNVSVRPEFLRLLLMQSSPVQDGQVHLITYEPVELERITDFRWSPYYQGTSINTLLASDPVIDGEHPDEVLAMSCRDDGHQLDAIFPVGLGTRSDSQPSPYFQSALAFCGDRAFTVARHINDDVAWTNAFTIALDDASNAGSLDVGFCTASRPQVTEWTHDDLADMLNVSKRVFATALDGDGYIVWQSTY